MTTFPAYHTTPIPYFFSPYWSRSVAVVEIPGSPAGRVFILRLRPPLTPSTCVIHKRVTIIIIRGLDPTVRAGPCDGGDNRVLMVELLYS